MSEIPINGACEVLLNSLWNNPDRVCADGMALAMVRAATRFLMETKGGRATWEELTAQADAVMESGNLFLGDMK